MGPEDVTPHTLWHSVAYRMLNVEIENTFYGVRNRIRHASIQTTDGSTTTSIGSDWSLSRSPHSFESPSSISDRIRSEPRRAG